MDRTTQMQFEQQLDADVSMWSLESLQQHGFMMVKHVFEDDAVRTIADQLDVALRSFNEQSILRSRGQTYGSRNLLDVLPTLANVVMASPLSRLATLVLGDDVGIVRVLYFDKPPGRSWSVPWHKDQTIAVKSIDQPSTAFFKPTVKAGVPHVEAPTWLLEKMLTLRIHLDAMNADNGPLSVIPGSHGSHENELAEPVELHADAGDVKLAMRPLLSHASTLSRAGIAAHRRVIHIELAGTAELPDGYEWHSFVRLNNGGHAR
ncbi:MAG: phytanoyl-CoA dioxygenase family protein [Planctomycetales bacterium]|nr:phytanoyl-CoA dioxygenase family protein [Planctomycetales bacterium]